MEFFDKGGVQIDPSLCAARFLHRNFVHITGVVQGVVRKRVLENGTRIANFNLLTKEKWNSKKTGSEGIREDSHFIEAYEGMVDLLDRLGVKEGMPLGVDGSIRYVKSKESDGRTNTKSVIFVHRIITEV